jgi:hypothetical protein
MLETNEFDFEIVLNERDFDCKDRFDVLINIFADNFGINKSDKIFYLQRICKFRNKKFPKNATKYQIVEELSK